MTTAIFATIVSIAFFIAVLIVFRLYRLCAELRGLLIAEYHRRKQIMSLLNQYASDNDSLAKTRDELAKGLEAALRTNWIRPSDQDD